MSDKQDTDLGLLPKDWDLVTLGDLLYIKGRIGWKGLKKSEYLSDGYAIINGEQIKSDEVDWGNVGRVPKERYDESPEIMLKKDDILMTKDGTIGKIAYIEELIEPATVASGVFVIRQASEKLNQRYLYNYFSSHFFKWLIKSRVEGSVIPHLYQRDFQEMLIPLPSIKEQESIADILHNISKKIKILHQQNHDLEELAQTLFNSWFVKFEFPDENGEPYLSSGGKMEASEFGEIPFGWKVGKVKNIANLNEQQVSKKDNMETIKYIDTGSLTKGVISEIKTLNYNEAPSRAKRRVKTNSILYSVVRPTQCHYGILKSIESNYIASTGFCVIDSVNHPHYLYLLLTQQRTIDYFESIANATASTYPTMRPDDIGNFEILIPDDSTLSCFEKVADNCWQKIDNNNKEIQSLTHLRDTLLPKLMSGELRVTNI